MRPIRLFYGDDVQDHTTGKVILREAYSTVSLWRRKDPIEMGSGATVIGHNTYWKDYQRRRVRTRDGRVVAEARISTRSQGAAGEL